MPQTHGAVRDAVDRLGRSIEARISMPKTAPRFSLEHPLALLGIALTDLANISQHRSYRLLDTRMTYGLPMNLMGERPGYNHGFPIIHTAAIAMLAEMKLLAPRSHGASRIDQLTGEVRSFEVEAAGRALDLLLYLRRVLAIEAFMSAQAMDLAARVLDGWHFGGGSAAAHAAMRTRVPYIDRNRFASDDMVAAEALLALGELNEAVEKEVGELD